MRSAGANPEPAWIGGLDQAVRYDQLAELLRRFARPGPVLEVGAGPASLKAWGWDDPVVSLDIVPMPGQAVRADATALPFADSAFATVVCSDVLEHVAPSARPRLLSELRRVGRDLIVIGGPLGTDAQAADRGLDRWHRRTGRTSPGWLVEHLAAGPYPTRDELVGTIGSAPLADVAGSSIMFHRCLTLSKFLPRGWEAGARLGRNRIVRRAFTRLAAAGASYRRVLVFDAAPKDFSVIIPTYNRGDQLVEAVQSVLDQSIENIEVLIVDDASTDSTPDLVAGLAAKDGRIRSLRLAKNTGSCGSARNAALPHARGAAIAFCDDDVRWHPEHLARCGEALRDADACVTQARRFLPDGRLLDVIGEPWGGSGPDIGQLDANALAVRRTVMRPFRDTRGRYFTDDAELAARLHRSGARFAFVSEPTVDYTFNPESHAFVYTVHESENGPSVTARPRIGGMRALRARAVEASLVRVGRLRGVRHPADRQPVETG